MTKYGLSSEAVENCLKNFRIAIARSDAVHLVDSINSLKNVERMYRPRSSSNIFTAPAALALVNPQRQSDATISAASEAQILLNE